jgi:hypothetical protein
MEKSSPFPFLRSRSRWSGSPWSCSLVVFCARFATVPILRFAVPPAFSGSSSLRPLYYTPSESFILWPMVCISDFSSCGRMVSSSSGPMVPHLCLTTHSCGTNPCHNLWKPCSHSVFPIFSTFPPLKTNPIQAPAGQFSVCCLGVSRFSLSRSPVFQPGSG